MNHQTTWDFPAHVVKEVQATGYTIIESEQIQCHFDTDFSTIALTESLPVWPGMFFGDDTSITMRIDKLLRAVRYFVQIQDAPSVRDYLLKYQELIDLVEKICIEARCEFLPPTQLLLKIYQDPEIDNDFLTLLIRQPEYPDDFMDKIGDFRDQYINNLSDYEGVFLITTDFKNPN